MPCGAVAWSCYLTCPRADWEEEDRRNGAVVDLAAAATVTCPFVAAPAAWTLFSSARNFNHFWFDLRRRRTPLLAFPPPPPS